MKMPWSNLEGPAKLLAICAAVLLVSSGLCGLQLFLAGAAYGRSDGLTILFAVLGVVELIAMAGSVVVGIISLLFWLSEAVTKRSSGSAIGLGRGRDQQELSVNEDSKDGDKQP
jgi:hypothetical protein